ncbi:MAG: winged helix-turn-helix domain-containing protein [Phascolarctobacterium sp.]
MSFVPPENFHVKVRIYNQEIAFGKGIAQILRLVDQYGSLTAAYKEMGMSSSKAWKILHRAEADLGFPLLTSVSGGAHGGGTVLTAEGRELLEKYQEFDSAVQNFAKESFSKIFGYKKAENP